MSEPVRQIGTPPRQDMAPSLPADATSSARAAGALTAVVLGAAQAEITAEATEATTGAPSDQPVAPPSAPPRRPRSRRPRVPRRANPSHYDARVTPAAATSAVDAPTEAATAAEVAAPPDTQSELRNWIKDNATLLSNASLLISISALALNLLPTTGVLDPYIKALIFGAALLLLIEMHHQWPEDLQLHAFRATTLPQNHSWRMTAFAIIMQVATIVFAVWATLTTPLILIPLTALGVIIAFRQWYFRRFRGVAVRTFGILALIVALVLSEVLMVVVWAVITGEQVTIQLWSDERPGLTLVMGPDPTEP
jgi:hypothetical protein